MIKMRKLLLGFALVAVVLGFALLGSGLGNPARWGGYQELLAYGPLLVLFCLGSFILPRRSRR